MIPARLGSQRFPRKVLARDTGKYLIEHVWEAVVGCAGVSRVIIATDSDEVLRASRSFGAEACMTSARHVSGTDRVAEVARGLDVDLVVNVQGDEPLITHADVRLLLALFDGPPGAEPVMSTLAVPRRDLEGFRDPNIVKAVFAADGRALYFSRSPVPHPPRTAGRPDSEAVVEWWQHLGIYAYRREFLLRFASLAPTPLEGRERLEQLRALEHGYFLRVGLTEGRHVGIDTEEEYRRFVKERRGPGPGPGPELGGAGRQAYNPRDS